MCYRHQKYENMGTRCLFGIFVFGPDLTLNYRFLSDDLFGYLHQTIQERRDPSDDEHMAPDEIGLSIDDKILLHFAPLLSFCNQTYSRNMPIRRITLASKLQVFFDQVGKNRLICMADGSFHTLVVLKTINLFKALIKFHIGALPFTKSSTVSKSIDRISASLPWYLNNITTNQSLLFESTEYLNISALIREQCTNACSIVNVSLQYPPTLILITSKDKIVHMQLSNEQNRPSNSDVFLLLLNNISRSIRTQFQTQENNSSHTMAHTYKTKNDFNINSSMTTSARESLDSMRLKRMRATLSLPTEFIPEANPVLDDCAVEVVFMKTSNKLLAPYTMYTIPITNSITVLILVEWKNSLACLGLSELINQLNLCINQLQLSYKRLSTQVKTVESHPTIRQYFQSRNMSTSELSKLLEKTHTLYKSQSQRPDGINEEDRTGSEMLSNLQEMSSTAVDIFQTSFFSSDDENQSFVASNNENKRLDRSAIENLQANLFKPLEDWFAFIETKSLGNITISFCLHDFPGLVHFALIDRSRGRICTPALFTEDYKNYLASRNNPIDLESIKEKKIIDFELECLTALQRGCTSYTVTDEYFTYNYTLRLQESNGASMRLYKPFIKSEPPGILHYDFYEKLAYENYASLGGQTSIACFEMICVHLRFVPPGIVREQCEQLWPKLMELDE